MNRKAEKANEDMERLRRENAAFRVQGMLLDQFVAMVHSSMEEEVLKACLQQTLLLATELTEAEKGSIFLLDDSGRVVDSILAHQASSREKSRLLGRIMDKGLAGWVCKHRTYGVVHDTDTDDRWLAMQNEPYNIGSALALPIVRGDSLFGVLTLHHSRKRHFTEDLIEAMQATASQIALVLENVKLYLELVDAKATAEVYSTALDREMEKGRKIQMDFLPGRIPSSPELEIAAEFIPAMQVSGDFYDAFALPGNLMGLVIGDVSDKGVGAALYMALIRSFLRMFAGQSCEETVNRAKIDPSDPDLRRELQASALRALEITNDYLAREHDTEGMFATVFFGIVDPHNGLLCYINAGHPDVFAVRKPAELVNLSAHEPAVGLQGGVRFQYKTHTIYPGTILFGYTDGVTEALSADGIMYGRKRLKRILSETVFASAADLVDRVRTDLMTFTGDAPRADDITMLAVHCKP